MLILKKLGCRIFQTAFRVALPILPYREPKIVSSCEGLGDVFEKEKVKSLLIVTDKGIVGNGLTEPLIAAVKKSKVRYVVYDKTQPNPTVANVEEALTLYHKNRCDALIAIGGGSSMDCAEAVGARVAWVHTTARTALMRFHITNPLSIKRHGLIYPCDISPIRVSSMRKCCI